MNTLVLPAVRRPGHRPGGRGFSLVEVVLALGIAATAFVVILSTLPTGLNNHGNSVARSRATLLVREITTCLQQATPSPNDHTTYTALAPFDAGPQKIQWTLGPPLASPSASPPPLIPNPAAPNYPIYFNENGDVTTAQAGNARFVAMIAIAAPGSDFSAGKAYVYVGWPVPANPVALSWVMSGSNNLAQYPSEQGHEEVTFSLDALTP